MCAIGTREELAVGVDLSSARCCMARPPARRRAAEIHSDLNSCVRIIAAALVAALSACDVSGPTVNLAPTCPYDDSSMNRNDTRMQLPKGACPSPQ